MICKDFEFLGKSLSDFGLICADSGTEDNTGLNVEILKAETTISNSEPVVYGVRKTEPLVLHFRIFKEACTTNGDGDSVPDTSTTQYLSLHEIRSIQKWLTGTKKPSTLCVDFEDTFIFWNGTSYYEMYENVCYTGIFTEFTPVIVGDMYGLDLSFECTIPYPYEARETLLSSSGTIADLTFPGDDIDYIYPTLKIWPTDGDNDTYGQPTDDDEDIFIFATKDNPSSDVYRGLRLKVDFSRYSQYIIDCKYKRILAKEVSTTTNPQGEFVPLTLADVLCAQGENCGYGDEESVQITNSSNTTITIRMKYLFPRLIPDTDGETTTRCVYVSPKCTVNGSDTKHNVHTQVAYNLYIKLGGVPYL